MFRRSLAMFLAGLAVPALVISAQTPVNTVHLSYTNFLPYCNGKVVYKIWAEVRESSQNPNQPPGGSGGGDPTPPPPGGGQNPPPGGGGGGGNPPKHPLIEHLYVEPHAINGPGFGPLDPTLYDPDNPYQPPDGGGGGGGGGTPPPSPALHTRELLMQETFYYSPRPLFHTRTTSAVQAVTSGVNQADIDALNTEYPQHEITFKEANLSMDGVINNYTPYTSSKNYADSYLSKGIVELNVDIPSFTGNWMLKVIDSLAREKVHNVNLVQGQNKITISGIEAGNVLVALFEVKFNGNENAYFQEAYALVRKNQTASINMAFASFAVPDTERYRIGYIGIGQNSQSIIENLPLQKNRDAMLRVMAYDAYGDGINALAKSGKIKISWTSPGGSDSKIFSSPISGHHTRSGGFVKISGTDIPGPVIPAQYIQPGLRIKAELLDNDANQILAQTDWTPVAVVEPRRIHINAYQVRPIGGSGVPVARSYNRWNEEIMPFVRDVFPYAEITYKYKGSITNPLMLGRGVGNHFMTMLLMNSLGLALPTDLGYNSTSGSAVLNLGVMNHRYSSSAATGMCFYWRPGISLAAAHGLPSEETAYVLAHEMGHAFGLEHAPSVGANSDFNRIDHNFHYGGGGMAGGWGYASIKYKEKGGNVFKYHKYFLSEHAHTADAGYNAHWDNMAYIPDRSYRSHAPVFYQNRRLSDHHMQKLLSALKINVPNPANTYQPPNIPLECLETLPGTDTLIFGPEAALAMEEAWFQTYGVRSIHAVNPHDISNTPLDFDATTLTVTPEGKIIFPQIDINAMQFLDGLGGPGGFDNFLDVINPGDDMGFPEDNEDDDDEDDEPPVLIITRLPRLIGVNVDN